ncbi:RNA-binding protein [Candidatus Villigracilis saccharophilus]|uniref:RNA recognition motif domain-containing protein n=1 Tax=Candidatus Villigracilis saccharophilus TaxID=3140684 RepID=UPI00313710C8|nr:RNA-binding protein [Anaerolineales bacterium]
MDVRIYVGNLAKSTTQEEINTLFATAGAVTSVDLVMDKGTGLSKGFAFVSMPAQADATRRSACSMLIHWQIIRSRST